jgi:hypothetical protein
MKTQAHLERVVIGTLLDFGDMEDLPFLLVPPLSFFPV